MSQTRFVSGLDPQGNTVGTLNLFSQVLNGWTFNEAFFTKAKTIILYSAQSPPANGRPIVAGKAGVAQFYRMYDRGSAEYENFKKFCLEWQEIMKILNGGDWFSVSDISFALQSGALVFDREAFEEAKQKAAQRETTSRQPLTRPEEVVEEPTTEPEIPLPKVEPVQVNAPKPQPKQPAQPPARPTQQPVRQQTQQPAQKRQVPARPTQPPATQPTATQRPTRRELLKRT